MSDVHAQPRGYVICSEPRSGTNFFCELLTQTGALGRPDEYFNAGLQRLRGELEYPDDPEAQFDQVLVRSTTPNGVYGLKMFTVEFDRLRSTRWAARLPNLKFIHMERQDYLAEAISEAKALQLGQHRSTFAPTRAGDARYDRRLIRQQFEAAARGHARWRMYFSRNQICPLYLSYEELVAEPGAAIHKVARFMGVAEYAEPNPSTVKLKVQRDEVSQAWRERFLSEESGLEMLDRFEPDTFWAFLRRKLKPAR